jgi:hypothetical protein
MVFTLRNCALVLMLVALAAGVALAGDNGGNNKNVRVDVRDACDPATFDAAVGPGTCLPGHSGGTITFNDFLAELGEDGSVGAWRFNPDALNPNRDVTFTLRSKGGETHTFTRVANFGGGVVPVLNQIGGFGETAPECVQPPSANNVIIPAGQTVAGPSVGAGESAKFQCCIHPWMRTTVNAENSHDGHQH